MTPLDNESYESSPLLESAGVDTRHSQTLRARLKSHVRDRRAAWESFSNYLRHAWKSYLEDFRYAWPLVWPDKDSGLQYRPIQCFGIFSFHRVLYLLVPYLFGTLVKLLDGKVQDDMIWFVLSGLFIGEFFKDYLCKSLQSWRWLEVALRSQKVISEKALAKYLGCPEKHETWATGGSLSDFNKGGCLNKCLEQILFVWIAIVFDLIMTAVFICVFLGIAYGMSSAAISLLYIYCVARNGQRSLPQRREVVEAKREKDAISKPILHTILEIVQQNGNEREFNRFITALDNYQRQKQKTSTALIFQSTLPNAVFRIVFLVMSAFTIWQIKHEQSTRQQFLLLYTYMNQLQQTLSSLEASVQEFLDGLVDTERVFRQLKENSSIGNLTNPRNTIEAAGIEFESVKAGSLKSLTFRCPEKTITAILGLPDRETPTLGHLLIRIAEAQNGIVRIGGVDVREYSVGLLRHNVGFIPRKCRLLGETIMQSLKYGLRNSENIERAAVEAACQTVNIHDTIMKIPGNYNAPMGHKGGGLKGKERRRLALARLLLQNPRILVVDGAITAIKGETDARLQDLLKAVFHQRTVLLLDHRMHAVESADQVLLLCGNKLVTSGSDAALSTGGVTKIQALREKG